MGAPGIYPNMSHSRKKPANIHSNKFHKLTICDCAYMFMVSWYGMAMELRIRIEGSMEVSELHFRLIFVGEFKKPLTTFEHLFKKHQNLPTNFSA